MPKAVSARRRALWNKSSLCGVGAIVATLFWEVTIEGVGADPPPPPEFWIRAWTLGPLALGLWIASCSAYAQSKGYSKALGVAGLLACCGFALLMLLPSRWREEPETGHAPGDYPRPER